MMTLDEIHALQVEVMERDRLVREQVRRYELMQAEINLRISFAVMQYQTVMARCWAIALGPSLQQTSEPKP